MKKALIAGGVVVVALVVVAVVVLTNLGSVVKSAIETVGPRVTQSDVTVEEVEISVSEGTAALAGLVVGNPEGYQTERAMRLGRIDVRLDTGSVTGDTIVIHEVVIDGPEMTYEVGNPRSNFQQLQKNAEDFAARNGGGGSAEPAEGSGGKKLVIENLYVRNAKVSVSAPFLQGREAGTRIPEIHLTDIGKDSGGATPAEVAARTLDAITARVIGAVGQLDLKGMMDGAAGKLKEGAEGALKEGGEGASKAVEDAGKAVEEGVGNALDSLGGD